MGIRRAFSPDSSERVLIFQGICVTLVLHIKNRIGRALLKRISLNVKPVESVPVGRQCATSGRQILLPRTVATWSHKTLARTEPLRHNVDRWVKRASRSPVDLSTGECHPEELTDIIMAHAPSDRACFFWHLTSTRWRATIPCCFVAPNQTLL